MIKREVAPGIIQVTMDDGRWYFDDKEKPYPSSTWILQYYPKGVGFDIYLADKVHSWEQAKQVLREAGEQGDRVHWGLQQYLLGKKITFNDVPPDSHYSFSPKEWEMILDGRRWVEKNKPIILGVEQVVFGEDYAGTVDKIYRTTSGKLRILDWKSGGGIYPSYKSQCASYVKALNSPEIEGFDIVRVGSRNKIGYEEFNGNLDDVEHYYELFRCAKKFWEDGNKDAKPKISQFPETISLEELDESEHKIENQREQKRKNKNGNESENKPGKGVPEIPGLL